MTDSSSSSEETNELFTTLSTLSNCDMTEVLNMLKSLADTKYAPYSFSRINTFNQCNRKFKYNVIDKLKPEKSDTTALRKGIEIHSVLEKHPAIPNVTETNLKIASTFINSELGKFYFNLNNTREVKFGLDNSLVPVQYSKNTLFRGFIDFVCIKDNVLMLVDWKTGKLKEQRYQDFTQLLLYAVFFFLKYPKIEKIKISYVYVEHNCENDLMLEREFLNNYINDLLTNIVKIEESTQFDKTENRLCEWCNYRTHCSNDN